MSGNQLEQSDVVYYAAMSLDGFIADAEGKADWLHPFFIPELGFHDFMTQVKGVVMGRRTYDVIEGYGKWPYGPVPGTIATHRSLGSLDAPVRAASGAPRDILDAAQATGPGPYWIVGGAELASDFLAAGLVTRLDIFVVPRLIGSGTRGFSPTATGGLGLIDTEHYINGVVRLSYRPDAHHA